LRGRTGDELVTASTVGPGRIGSTSQNVRREIRITEQSPGQLGARRAVDLSRRTSSIRRA
jgi:hypothetical protein